MNLLTADICRGGDIPGASLKDPGTLKIPQLKRWLQCRKASTKGKNLQTTQIGWYL